jgi:predicted ATP-dependent serine protease
MSLTNFDWLNPDTDEAKGSNGNGWKPKGWIDDLLNGPIPENKRNHAMQSMVSRWRNIPGLTEAECRTLAMAKARDWKYDDEEYTKLEGQLKRAYEREPVNERVNELGTPDQRNTLSSFVSRLIEPQKQDRTISSGLTELDYELGGDRATKLLGGYSPGHLVYIVGEKGTGKSILTNHTVVHILKQQPRGVAYLCPEMSYDGQMIRMFSAVLGSPAKKIRNHMLGRQPLSAIEVGLYKHTAQTIGAWPLVVRDDIRSIDDVEQVIETWPKEWAPLEALVVDSPYVLSAPAGTSAGRFALEANSARLMALTKKHNLVTLAPCQISRPQGTAAAASNWRPTR